MVMCLGQGTDLHMAQLMPLPVTISCSSKSRLVLPFWCRVTRVVLDKIQEGHKMVVCYVCVCVCISRTLLLKKKLKLCDNRNPLLWLPLAMSVDHTATRIHALCMRDNHQCSMRGYTLDQEMQFHVCSKNNDPSLKF